MTIRAAIIGVLAAAVFCGACYFNDNVIRQTRMVGSYMPVALLGALLLCVLLVNPLLGWLRRRSAFSGKELALMVAIGMTVAFIPGYGLMEHFTNLCIMPHQLAVNNPNWAKDGLFEYLPPQMVVDVSIDRGDTLSDFLQGKAFSANNARGRFGLQDIPWYAWKTTLSFWLPLLAALSVGLIGLALAIHQQWSVNESLQYPIAKFAAALMPDEGEGVPAVFRNKLFWLGLLGVFLIHMVNYVHLWWPDKMWISVPLSLDLTPLMKLSDTFWKGVPVGLAVPHLFFTAMAFAFFLSSDLSLSVGVAPYLHTYAMGLLVVTGVDYGGGHMTANLGEFLYAGAWAAMGLMLLYLGRRYYFQTLRGALFLSCDRNVKGFSIWGARVFLLAMALFVCLLIRVGLDWPLAVLYSLVAVMMFVVMSRIVAETGVFFLHQWHFPGATLLGFLGLETIGPKGLLIMMMVSSVIILNPRESLMPYVVNALKVASLKGLSPGRPAAVGGLALVIGLLVAAAATLYWQYDLGAFQVSDSWARDYAPKFGISAWAGHKEKWEADNGRELREPPRGLSRFALVKPNPKLLKGFAVTAGLVLLFSFLRMRFAWWPLHPVMFLLMGTWQAQVLAGSFLLGWLIKTLTVGLSGRKTYLLLRPLMIGLIAGEILAGVLQMGIGAAYYFTTGWLPKPYWVMPG